MISHRYHMITIVAVFLSLGLGIILGGSIGQNWINEKQQTLLVGLGEKYDQALQSNSMLQDQIQELSVRIEQANEEFSLLVSKGYLTDLNEKTIGLWIKPGNTDVTFTSFLQSVGMKVVRFNEAPSTTQLSFPILVIGEGHPPWAKEVPDGLILQVDKASLTPSEQWELLQRIQEIYKEKDNEY